jgi:hypothetical protein
MANPFQSLVHLEQQQGQPAMHNEVLVVHSVCYMKDQSHESQRFMDYLTRSRAPAQQAPTEVFGRRIVGTVAPEVFPRSSVEVAGHVAASPASSEGGFAWTPFAPLQVPGPAAANGGSSRSIFALDAAASANQSRQQQLADERLAQELQHELWTQEIPSQSVPRASLVARNPSHPMAAGAPNMFQPVTELQQPRRISSRSSGGLSAGAAAAIVDLPPHVAPMIIAEAIKQKQACSISFEDISSENACVTTCGHVFTRDSMKEWLKQKSTCPECRKHCRISGEPAAPPPSGSGSGPIFGVQQPQNPAAQQANAFNFVGPNFFPFGNAPFAPLASSPAFPPSGFGFLQPAQQFFAGGSF